MQFGELWTRISALQARVVVISISFLVTACAVHEMKKQDILPASVVQQQLEAYNRHDLDSFVAAYSENVRLYRMPASAPAISGKGELADFYRSSRFNIRMLHASLLHRTVLGNKVIDHELITGLRNDPVEAVVVYQVINGQIDTVWLFSPE